MEIVDFIDVANCIDKNDSFHICCSLVVELPAKVEKPPITCNLIYLDF